MGIERIGGGGAINVSASQKVSKPEIQVADMAQTPVAKPDSVAPVTTESKSGFSQQNAYENQDGNIQSEKEISPEKVKSAVDDINKQIKMKSNLRSTQCSFKYHEDTNRISITVKDKETDEVIREIPPEKALDMLAKAWELAGLMVDERR